MRRNILFAAAIIITSLFLLSCSSYDEMLDDYNSNFTPVYETVEVTVLKPGDEGFLESSMLNDYYNVYQYATLCLSAPADCDSYLWTVEKEGSVLWTSDTRQFVVYIPESKFKTGNTYYLYLTVVKDEFEYSDLCGVAIYSE